MDPTLISRAFDAGNYAAAYESEDLEFAVESCELPDEYIPAFILGFCASLELWECQDPDYVLWCEATECGQAVISAGYCEAKIPLDTLSPLD